MEKNCIICNKSGKYKCPKCLTFNCSLSCFKAHKDEKKCKKIEPESIVVDSRPDKINVFTTYDTVSTEKLELLSHSESIKNLLKNPHLRNFLKEINSVHNSWNAMKLAMMEPIFVEFADECMKVVEPQEEKTEGSMLI